MSVSPNAVGRQIIQNPPPAQGWRHPPAHSPRARRARSRPSRKISRPWQIWTSCRPLNLNFRLLVWLKQHKLRPFRQRGLGARTALSELRDRPQIEPRQVLRSHRLPCRNFNARISITRTDRGTGIAGAYRVHR